MNVSDIRWREMARSMGGLAAVATLLAHFIHPELPLTLARIELLLVLIGALLGLDMLVKRSVNVSLGGQGQHQVQEGERDDG